MNNNGALPRGILAAVVVATSVASRAATNVYSLNIPSFVERQHWNSSKWIPLSNQTSTLSSSQSKGWSTIQVTVVDDATGKPVAGARIDQLCKACAYANEHPMTDTNGLAKVMVYETWVALKAAKGDLTNSVFLFDTKAISHFRTNCDHQTKGLREMKTRANHPTAANPAIAVLCHIARQWRGVVGRDRSA